MTEAQRAYLAWFNTQHGCLTCRHIGDLQNRKAAEDNGWVARDFVDPRTRTWRFRITEKGWAALNGNA